MYTAVELKFTESFQTIEFSEEDISLPIIVSSLFERGGRGEKCLKDVNQEQSNHRDGKSIQGTDEREGGREGLVNFPERMKIQILSVRQSGSSE